MQLTNSVWRDFLQLSRSFWFAFAWKDFKFYFWNYSLTILHTSVSEMIYHRLNECAECDFCFCQASIFLFAEECKRVCVSSCRSRVNRGDSASCSRCLTIFTLERLHSTVCVCVCVWALQHVTINRLFCIHNILHSATSHGWWILYLAAEHLWYVACELSI